MISHTLRTAEIGRQQALNRRIEDLQVAISTGNKFEAPSDAPVAAARVAGIRREQSDGAAWKGNVDTAAALASRADGSLKTVSSILDRARELMIQGNNGTMSAADRATAAAELRGMLPDLDSLANESDSRGAALFPAGEPLQVPIGRGVTAAATGSRDSVFGGVATKDGPATLSAILTAAAAALEEPDPALRKAASSGSLDAVNAGVEHVADARAAQGNRARRLDNAGERLADLDSGYEVERSSLQGTDYAEAYSKLQSLLLTLNAAQTSFARITQDSLFSKLG